MTWFDILTRKESGTRADEVKSFFGSAQTQKQYTNETLNQNTYTTKKTSNAFNYNLNVINSSGVSASPSPQYTDTISIIPTQSASANQQQKADATSGGLNQLLLLGGVAVLGLAIFKGVVK